MKVILIFAVSILLATMLHSCALYGIAHSLLFRSKFDSDRFVFKFDGKDKGLDSLINIDGYYYLKTDVDKCSEMMFYRDGTYSSCPDYLHNSEIEDTINSIRSWGSYRIFHDTIKIQSIYKVVNFPYYKFMDERWFKVIGRDTIVEVFYSCYYYGDPKYDLTFKYNDTAIFIPLETRPDSTCWLKEEDWAWEKK